MSLLGDAEAWSTTEHERRRRCLATAQALLLRPCPSRTHPAPAPAPALLTAPQGIINNPSFSRYVRFNAMQAVLLDIILMWAARGAGSLRGSPKGRARSQRSGGRPCGQTNSRRGSPNTHPHPLLLPCSLPGLLESVFRPPIGGPGLQLYISLYNTIFL